MLCRPETEGGAGGEESPNRVSAPTGAVFLSYASQDAGAAKQICDALCAAGIEVWFDQSELRGGDAWDRRIRQQIRDCALFVPVISAQDAGASRGLLPPRMASRRAAHAPDRAPARIPCSGVHRRHCGAGCRRTRCFPHGPMDASARRRAHGAIRRSSATAARASAGALRHGLGRNGAGRGRTGSSRAALGQPLPAPGLPPQPPVRASSGHSRATRWMLACALVLMVVAASAHSARVATTRAGTERAAAGDRGDACEVLEQQRAAARQSARGGEGATERSRPREALAADRGAADDRDAAGRRRGLLEGLRYSGGTVALRWARHRSRTRVCPATCCASRSASRALRPSSS